MDEAKIVALSERAKKGAQLLARHARIPPPCREQFLNETGQILFSAGLDDTGNIKYWGDQQLKKTVLEVEAGLRRALIAIRSFPVPFFSPLMASSRR